MQAVQSEHGTVSCGATLLVVGKDKDRETTYILAPTHARCPVRKAVFWDTMVEMGS